jgi:predicted Zn-dependent protease with MMP-like domain
MLNLTNRRFEELVREAIETLPPYFRERLENVDVVIEGEPSPELLEEMGMDPEQDTLYGLYQRTPLTERDPSAPWQRPDKISIYRTPLQEACETEDELVEEVQVTIVHEFAHFFGIDEDELQDLGWD